MGEVLRNSKGQLFRVRDLPYKVGISQSDLKKIANSVAGVPSKAAI